MAKETLNQGEIDAILNELEVKMQRLRTLYEQYFLGIERMAPITLRKDVFRIVQRFENIYIRNTAQKFRLRSLIQRFNAYKAYWGRIERQIEEGTYVRDIHRAKRNQERRQQRSSDDGLPIIELDLELDAVDDLQAELEEMERAGAFDNSNRPRMSNEPQMPSHRDSGESEEDKERRRQQKLAEIRAQLGGGGEEPAPRPQPTAAASSDSDDDDRQSKLARLKTRLNRGEPAPAANEIRGADMDKLRKLAEMKAKIEAEREASPSVTPNQPRTIQRASSAQRVVQRPSAGSGDDEARQVYDKLIATKRQLNESTQGLSYEQVRTSMQAQRDQIRQSRGASDVEFQVVVKDGRAFLKPVPK